MTLDWGDSDDDAAWSLPPNWEQEEARMLQERINTARTAASSGGCPISGSIAGSMPPAQGGQLVAPGQGCSGDCSEAGAIGIMHNEPVLCAGYAGGNWSDGGHAGRRLVGHLPSAPEAPRTISTDRPNDRSHNSHSHWNPQIFAFGQQNRPPNPALLERGAVSGQVPTTKYHPYHPYSKGASQTSDKNHFLGGKQQKEKEKRQQQQTQRTTARNQMGLVVPRDAKSAQDVKSNKNGKNNKEDDNDHLDGKIACPSSSWTVFGDPLVSLSRTEAWVNEIMSQQFADDPSVAFHGKGSSVISSSLSSQARSFWTFPFSRYDQVIKALKTESNPDAIIELAPTVVSTLRISSRIKDDSMRYGHIPPEMEAKLMPFQRDGIKFILRRGGRALLGDEMGLGKTVQALGAVSAYRDEWPVMIMCPSSLRESWNVAIQEWLEVPEHKIRVVHTGKDAESTVFGTFQFLVISYGFLDKIQDSDMFNIVVVDESHALKDWTAKRTKSALPVLKKAKRVILLTGTPALNRPKEIFTQLAAVASKANLKLKDFGERYCEGSRWDKYAGSKNLGELFALLHSSVMIRRLKKDVLSQLPRKRRQKVFLGLDAAGKKQLGKLKEQMDESRAALISSILSGKSGAIRDNGIIMEVYKKTAELKVKAVQEYVSTLIETGEKFLIFAHHIALLDAIEHACNRSAKSSTGYIRIDGSTPAKQRADLVDSFQNKDDIQVAILSIKAAGVGLTLTAASTVVFSELTWVPGDLIQAEDRAHRIGQQNAVNVSFLMVKNSIDELIWNTIEQKLEQLGECLNGEQQTMQVVSSTQRETGQPSILSYFSSSQKD